MIRRQGKPRLSPENQRLVEQAFEAIREARRHLEVARKVLAVETGVRAGGIDPNHSRTLLVVR